MPLPPAPTLGGALTAWTPDAGGLLLAGGLAVGYALGSRHDRRPARTACWAGGLGVLLLASCGWTGAYAHTLLWAFTLQVVVLLLVVPVLLAYGRPLELLPDGVHRVLARLADPLVGPLLVPVLLAVVFFTPVLRWSLADPAVLAALQLTLVATGLLLAVGVVGDEEGPATSLAVGAAVAVGFGELLLDAIPGIVLRLRTHVLDAGYWQGLHRPYGGTQLIDQQHAGAVLWFVAEAVDLPFLVILVRRWIRTDEREAARVDAALDAEYAARPVSPVEVADPDAPELVRPWWETDPDRLGGHRVTRRR